MMPRKLDSLEMLKRLTDSNHVFVKVDQFTKWVELAALLAQDTELTAKAFLKRFVVIFGCPLEIHTDQGKNFTPDLSLAFCKLMEITQTRTTTYRPAGNGQCEVFNRTVLQMVRFYVSQDKDEHLLLNSMTLHSMKNLNYMFFSEPANAGSTCDSTYQPYPRVV